MECLVQWTGSGVSFSATTGSGHEVPMDGAVESGGRNSAPRPMELLLAGMGGCTAYDVVTILKKGRHDVLACQVAISAERADNDPKVFTRIHLTYKISGRHLRLDVVERAVNLSKEKYCSASIMLGKTADISHEIELLEVQQN